METEQKITVTVNKNTNEISWETFFPAHLREGTAEVDGESLVMKDTDGDQLFSTLLFPNGIEIDAAGMVVAGLLQALKTGIDVGKHTGRHEVICQLSEKLAEHIAG